MSEFKKEDWDYLDGFSGSDLTERKIKSLEEYQDESQLQKDLTASFPTGQTADEALNKTIEEVKLVREQMLITHSTREIAQALNLPFDRVHLIQQCMYGATEDVHDFSVAHLVMMEG